MGAALTTSIVRILKPDGTTAGTGFVVTDDGLIATCAHVVADAGAGPGRAVCLVFHHASEEATATVEPYAWRDPDEEDIAILRLERPVPEGVTPLPLGYSIDVSGHRFKTYGFPDAGDTEGLWGYGVLGDPTKIAGQGVVQLTGTTEVTPGFSGAPVWDQTAQWVVGMVTAIMPPDSYGRLGETAFITPIETLVEVRPSVLGQALLEAEIDRLRARRDEADRQRREMRERQRVVNVRSLDVTHTFKDRLREMRDLCDYLADSSVRLVSVVGRGGMGKTALVSRILADLERGVLPVPGEERELSINGILYLSARSTGLSLERIYVDVGRMLGEPTAGRLAARWADKNIPLTAKVGYLLESLQDGLYLVVLDNMEDHLGEEGEVVEEGLRLFIEHCLTQPSGARLVATSREQVRIGAKALAGARTVPLRQGLPEEEAVALLRDLDPQGDLGLREASEEDLRRAAQLTQGIPRALELLAGILDRDPSASLPRLLADACLFGEQVVGQLVAEGHRRLRDEERRVMEALAVFDRPVEETAIAYLLHPWYPGLDVRVSLRRLVGGYFVTANRATGEYSLHPLDREYAYRQLPEPPGSEGEPNAYTRHTLELRAADFYARIRKPESEWKTIDDLAPQLAEFEHRVRAGDYDDACRLLELIDSDYLYRWGYYIRLVAFRGKLLRRLTDPTLCAYNLGGLGDAYRALGQIMRAAKLYEEALAAARKTGDRRGEGIWLGNLGRAYHELGQFQQAIRLNEQALAIFREVGNREKEGIELGTLGSTYRALGHVERAISFYEEALAIAHETGNLQEVGIQLGNLGSAYRDLGHVRRGIEFHKEALAIARKMRDRWREGFQLGYLGSAHNALGQFERAIKFYREAVAIDREIGDRLGEGIQLGRLGIAHHALGQVEQAIDQYEQALAVNLDIGDRWGESIWLSYLGLAYLDTGRVGQAIELQKEALTIACQIGHRQVESNCLLRLGKTLLAVQKPLEAQRYCADACDLDIPETSYKAALTLGIALLHQHDPASLATFTDAVTRCQAMLDKTEGLYEPRYALAAALVGQAACDPRWAEESECAELLAPTLAEYRRALEICRAPGVVQDALRDLELIRSAGIEGLEPVFELLQSVEASNDN